MKNFIIDRWYAFKSAPNLSYQTDNPCINMIFVISRNNFTSTLISQTRWLRMIFIFSFVGGPPAGFPLVGAGGTPPS